ncbi:hypothetical protein KJ813_04665 [bacterium]|nr:hypothetical protein [bacterium]
MNTGLYFEHVMGLFLGEKAYGCAGEETNEKARNERLNNVAKVILKRIDKLDTTTRHKEKLLLGAEKFFEATKGKDISTKNLLYNLLWLCGGLLGFEFNGRINAITHSLFYWQNKNQYITSNIIEGNDDSQEYEDKKYIFNTRKKIINKLKEEGFTYFKIAIIFNTTEYQIKKIIKEL